MSSDRFVSSAKRLVGEKDVSEKTRRRNDWSPSDIAYTLVSLVAVFWMSRNAPPRLGERCVTQAHNSSYFITVLCR